MIKIYTDGACKGNPGVGGWGAIIMQDEKNIELFGGENETTNNRMELMAVIMALKKTPSNLETPKFGTNISTVCIISSF